MQAGAYVNDHIVSEEWRGHYLGVRWRIRKWEMPDSMATSRFGPTWNFYLVISRRQVPAEDWPRYWLPSHGRYPWGTVNYAYTDSLLGDLAWHGGITYYRKLGHDDEDRVVEAGCDYAHAWDLDRGTTRITFEEVLRDVQGCIESLRELQPDLLWYCGVSRKYYQRGNGRLDDSGQFISEKAESDIGEVADE